MTRRRLIASIAAAAAVGAFAVWFAGFDLVWALTTVLIVGAVGAVVATQRLDEPAPWEPPPRETPRGVRLAVTTIEQSLAACDRLARPAVVRQLRAMIVTDRDDRVARPLVRRMHALLDRDSLAVLQPNGDDPVTSAAVDRALDACERQTITSPRSS